MEIRVPGLVEVQEEQTGPQRKDAAPRAQRPWIMTTPCGCILRLAPVETDTARFRSPPAGKVPRPAVGLLPPLRPAGRGTARVRTGARPHGARTRYRAGPRSARPDGDVPPPRPGPRHGGEPPAGSSRAEAAPAEADDAALPLDGEIARLRRRIERLRQDRTLSALLTDSHGLRAPSVLRASGARLDHCALVRGHAAQTTRAQGK